MGLLGNVAEVDYLRWRLMQHQYVTVFARLLSYDSDLIEVRQTLCIIQVNLILMKEPKKI